VERTFPESVFFAKSRKCLARILHSVACAKPEVGYIQGMNFIGAVLLYHCGESLAFHLFIKLLDKYGISDVFLMPEMNGLEQHNREISRLLQIEMPDLFFHFIEKGVSLHLFTTEWIISLFLNCIPIELTSLYLDLFFDIGWPVFYLICIEVLRHYKPSLLLMNEASDIVG
jgi:TBC1 domain family member 14